MPSNFAEADNGLLIIANGFDPVLRWDGMTNVADTAGVIAPTQALTIAGGAVPGQIVGTYNAYLRYVDNNGNFSNLSPVSASITPTSTSGSITGASNTTPIVITSPGHGLTNGVMVKVSGVGGNLGANGTWTIVVVDANNFSLTGSAGTGSGVTTGGTALGEAGVPNVPIGQESTGTGNYTGAGTWTAGVSSIVYSNVQTPTEFKVQRRQLLRNTDGQQQTYYVDIDTTDLTATTFTSTQIDTQLNTGVAVPLFDVNGNSLANRFNPPPAHKAVPVAHLGRMFYMVEFEYTQGCAQVVFSSPTVQGIGTEWTASMVGRFFYVDGEQQGYQILKVDTINQVLTLQGPITTYINNQPMFSGGYIGATDNFAVYSIRPAPAERRLIYYSEAGLPEAVPPTNAIALMEDGDEITGGMAKGSFIYILERRRTYRFTFQTDPANDGFIFRVLTRGCINQRCWVNVDEIVYMLDEAGVHAFSYGEGQPVSTQIQDLFRPGNSNFQINWTAYKFFHACHFPMQETIRWFVSLDGYYLPHHAIVYEYRKKRWWLEQYSRPIGASVPGRQKTINPFIGVDAKKIFALWKGTLDGPKAGSGTLRGSVSSAGILSLTDSLATFPASGIVGNTVCIVQGTGRGQQRLIASVSGQTISLTEPWSIIPDKTSIYQLGGIAWDYKTGAFRFLNAEEETEERRIEVVAQPTTNPCLARMNIFYNRLSTPDKQTSLYTSTAGDGVASQAGDPDLVLDLTKPIGFWQKRISNHKELYADGVRFLEVELFGFSNTDPIVFNFLNIDGAKQ